MLLRLALVPVLAAWVVVCVAVIVCRSSVMRIAIAVIAVLLALPAWAQTLPACPPNSTVTPQPWHETRVSWTAPTTYSDGSAFAAGTVLTYTVFRRPASGTFAAVCSTTSMATALPNQPIGQNFYTVTARTSTSAESAQAVPDDKTTVEPVPNQPTNIQITREGYWLCNKADGSKTQHVAEPEAFESCANEALLAGSSSITPPGYRIVAR